MIDRRAPACPIHIAGARLVDPLAGTDAAGGLLILDGRIADAGPHLMRAGSGPPEADVVTARGAVLSPGLVDIRAFVGEPGEEHRETLATASRAAAAGGVTTLVCQPDTSPVIDDPAIVDFVQRRARDTAVVRVAVAAALTRGLKGRELAEIGLLREAGAVAFTDGKRSVRDAGVMRRAMAYAAMFDAPVCVMHEDADLKGEGVMNEGLFASRLGLKGVPAAAEASALERDLRLQRLTGGRLHAALLSCRDSLDVLARARDEGSPVTAGVSINHLALNEIDVGDYRTFLKLSPPLRGEDDRLALVEALRAGLIDVIVSDHDPQDVETKRRPFADCADGAVGLETLLPVALRLVHDGSLPLGRLLAALSTRPAAVLGLPGGSLAKGAVADLALFDLDAPFVVDAAKLRSRAKNTPFDEARLQGVVLGTWVGGRRVFGADEVSR